MCRSSCRTPMCVCSTGSARTPHLPTSSLAPRHCRTKYQRERTRESIAGIRMRRSSRSRKTKRSNGFSTRRLQTARARFFCGSVPSHTSTSNQTAAAWGHSTAEARRFCSRYSPPTRSRFIASHRMNRRVIARKEWLWLAAAAALLLALSIAPNVLGYLVAGSEYHFSGVVYLPEDGDSYVAKIREGMQGAWLYSLAFDAEPGPPIVVYTYYLLWGHLAEWIGWEPEIVFIGARAFGGAL